MNRKKWFAIFFAMSLGLHIHLYMQGRIHPQLLLMPFFILWGAGYLPVAFPVEMIERYGFHFEPWADEHVTTTRLVLTLAAALLWFFPVARVRHWFGTFTAFVQQFRPLRARNVADAALAYEEKGGTK